MTRTDLPTAPPVALLQAATRAGERYGVDLRTLLGIAWVESRYVATAFNERSKAAGPFQLMPITQFTLGVSDPYNYEQAADAAARFIAHQGQRFPGRGICALAAYNWGPTHVANHPDPAEWPESVRQYVANVAEAARLVPLPPTDVDVLVMVRDQSPHSQSPGLLQRASASRAALRRIFRS